MTASAAITVIDALADFDLTGVREIEVINKTAALISLDFSVFGGPIYVYPGESYILEGNLSGTMAFAGVSGTNVGAAVAGVSPYIQVIAKSQ